jgi:hypothetical protein
MSTPRSPASVRPSRSTASWGELYAFKVTSRTPQTVRYEITSGVLPAGLTLNKDTGGVTGIPAKKGAATFTVTARNSGGAPDASARYRMNIQVA